MRLFPIALLGLLLATQSVAANNLKFGHRGEVLPVSKIATFESREGEDLEAFVMRMGGWFRTFTTSSGYEACAYILKAADGSDRWAMPVYTNTSQIGCVMGEVAVEGFVATGETIHSHPVERRIDPNAQDRVFMAGQSKRFNVERRQRRGVDPRTFSDTDFESGAGYLVADDKVLYQNGRASVREVGVLPAADPTP